MRTRIILALTFIISAVAYCALAAGSPSTVTLGWDPIVSSIPCTVRLYGSTNAAAPRPWTVLTNVPSTDTNVIIAVSKQPVMFFYATAVNATNSIWESDPSNVAQTLWPNQGGALSIAPGR